MREIDLCKENPKLFEPSSDLITPEEYEKMPPEVRAKVLSMPPGARHLALPPLPVDFEAVCKALIPKLEAIPQVESLWIYEDNPITPSFWWVDAHLALLGRHPVTHIAQMSVITYQQSMQTTCSFTSFPARRGIVLVVTKGGERVMNQHCATSSPPSALTLDPDPIVA